MFGYYQKLSSEVYDWDKYIGLSYGHVEDEANALMYKKFSDYSFIHTSIVVTLLALSLNMIATENILFIIISIVLLIGNFYFGHYIFQTMQYASPERKITDISISSSPNT